MTTGFEEGAVFAGVAVELGNNPEMDRVCELAGAAADAQRILNDLTWQCGGEMQARAVFIEAAERVACDAQLAEASGREEECEQLYEQLDVLTKHLPSELGLPDYEPLDLDSQTASGGRQAEGDRDIVRQAIDASADVVLARRKLRNVMESDRRDPVDHPVAQALIMVQECYRAAGRATDVRYEQNVGGADSSVAHAGFADQYPDEAVLSAAFDRLGIMFAELQAVARLTLPLSLGCYASVTLASVIDPKAAMFARDLSQY